MKKGALKLVVVLAVAVSAVVLLVRDFHITDFHVVKPGVLYTSGQPRGMDYTRLLYKYHIATIVNLRLPSEHRERNWYNEEVSWTKRNSVDFVALPLARTEYFPSEQAQGEFLSIMRDSKRLPVLVHGSGGKRVAMMVAVWLVLGQGVPPEEAIKDVERIKEAPLSAAERAFVAALAK